MTDRQEHIAMKLSEYIVPQSDTDSEWPLPDIIQEGNNNSNIIVERNLDNFKLYLINGPSGFDFTGLFSYYSIITFKQHEIFSEKIFLKRKFFYTYIYCGLFIIIFNILLIYNNDDFKGMIFLLPFILGYVIHRVMKKKFRKFLYKFLNEL